MLEMARILKNKLSPVRIKVDSFSVCNKPCSGKIISNRLEQPGVNVLNPFKGGLICTPVGVNRQLYMKVQHV